MKKLKILDKKKMSKIHKHVVLKKNTMAHKWDIPYRVILYIFSHTWVSCHGLMDQYGYFSLDKTRTILHIFENIHISTLNHTIYPETFSMVDTVTRKYKKIRGVRIIGRYEDRVVWNSTFPNLLYMLMNTVKINVRMWKQQYTNLRVLELKNIGFQTFNTSKNIVWPIVPLLETCTCESVDMNDSFFTQPWECLRNICLMWCKSVYGYNWKRMPLLEKCIFVQIDIHDTFFEQSFAQLQTIEVCGCNMLKCETWYEMPKLRNIHIMHSNITDLIFQKPLKDVQKLNIFQCKNVFGIGWYNMSLICILQIKNVVITDALFQREWSNLEQLDIILSSCIDVPEIQGRYWGKMARLRYMKLQNVKHLKDIIFQQPLHKLHTLCILHCDLLYGKNWYHMKNLKRCITDDEFIIKVIERTCNTEKYVIKKDIECEIYSIEIS